MGIKTFFVILMGFWPVATDDVPGGAALARAYGTQVEPPAPGGSHPHWPQMQKSLLIEQAF